MVTWQQRARNNDDEDHLPLAVVRHQDETITLPCAMRGSSGRLSIFYDGTIGRSMPLLLCYPRADHDRQSFDEDDDKTGITIECSELRSQGAIKGRST